MFGYGKEFLRHLENPGNVGKLENPEAFAEAKNPSCEDRVHVYLRIENGKITDARFLARGCATAIASSSFTMKSVVGMAVKEALAIRPEEIIRRLGGVPENKAGCANTVTEALHTAISRYLMKE